MVIELLDERLLAMLRLQALADTAKTTEQHCIHVICHGAACIQTSLEHYRIIKSMSLTDILADYESRPVKEGIHEAMHTKHHLQAWCHTRTKSQEDSRVPSPCNGWPSLYVCLSACVSRTG